MVSITDTPESILQALVSKARARSAIYAAHLGRIGKKIWGKLWLTEKIRTNRKNIIAIASKACTSTRCFR